MSKTVRYQLISIQSLCFDLSGKMEISVKKIGIYKKSIKFALLKIE